jgi:hypothetical protein
MFLEGDCRIGKFVYTVYAVVVVVVVGKGFNSSQIQSGGWFAGSDSRGAFTNYVDKILPIIDHLLTFVKEFVY